MANSRGVGVTHGDRVFYGGFDLRPDRADGRFDTARSYHDRAARIGDDDFGVGHQHPTLQSGFFVPV